MRVEAGKVFSANWRPKHHSIGTSFYVGEYYLNNDSRSEAKWKYIIHHNIWNTNQTLLFEAMESTSNYLMMQSIDDIARILTCRALSSPKHEQQNCRYLNNINSIDTDVTDKFFSSEQS